MVRSAGIAGWRFAAGGSAIALLAAFPSAAPAQTADERATATLQRMTAEEKTVLTHGIMPLKLRDDMPAPPTDAHLRKDNKCWSSPRD